MILFELIFYTTTSAVLGRIWREKMWVSETICPRPFCPWMFVLVQSVLDIIRPLDIISSRQFIPGLKRPLNDGSHGRMLPDCCVLILGINFPNTQHWTPCEKFLITTLCTFTSTWISTTCGPTRLILNNVYIALYYLSPSEHKSQKCY
jgi:hypothetical protein